MPSRPVALADTEVHPLRSEAVGDDFELWIAHAQPGFGPVAPAPPRILYLLDANLLFGTAVEATRLMHRLWGELPPITVVGIAHATDDPGRQAVLRSRDFTPSRDPGFAEGVAGAGRGPGSGPPPPPPPMGGAAAFLRFLRDDVRSWVSGHLEAGGEESILFGSSLAGLFVTWTLLTAPDTASRYLAVSPALWWDRGRIFDLEEERAAVAADLTATLHLAVGEREEAPGIPALAPYRMVSNVHRLADRLESRGYASLKLRREVLAGETHTSAAVVGLVHGLRALTRPPTRPRPPAGRPPTGSASGSAPR